MRSGESVVVRPMTGEDSLEVAELCTQLGYPSSAEEVARRLDSLLDSGEAESGGLFVAEGGGGQVVGWIHVEGRQLLERDAFAEVSGLVVDAEERGRGVGARLMAEAEGWARARGYREVWLRSNVAREQAHIFYRRIGYETVKTSYTFRKVLTATHVTGNERCASLAGRQGGGPG